MRFQHFPVNCKFNQFTNIWMNQRWGY